MVEHQSCDVCSRTILKGEQLHEYMSPQGERFGVCVLCRSRAEASGWIPAEQYGTIAHEPPARAGRGQALRRRLGEVASRARGGERSSRKAAKPPDDEEHPDPEGHRTESGHGGEHDPAARPATPTAPPPPSEEQAVAEEPPAAAKTAPAREPQAPKPTRRPRSQAKRRPKRQPAKRAATPSAPRPRRGPEAIMRKAVEHFNSSEERRKVAGLIRSLGAPQAAVRPDPGRQLAVVTVAWELSWYQWEVGANGDDGVVREVAKGKEVSELTDDARAWNAAVDEDGSLKLRGSAVRRRASANEA